MKRTREDKPSSQQPQPIHLTNIQQVSAAEFEARLRAEWDRLEAELAANPQSHWLLNRLNSVDARLAAVEAQA